MREYRTYEQKLTHVALGVTMVKDAAQRYGDRSGLITADTDLTPAIHAATELAPDRPIYLACPPELRVSLAEGDPAAIGVGPRG